MKPRVLLTLRCPRRCLLGVVVATSEGPRLIVQELALYESPDGGTKSERQQIGPLDLDEQHVSVGCRHSAGSFISDQRMSELRSAVDLVRRGSPGALKDFVVEASVVG